MSKWKMVPLEPTDEMIHAIDGLICSSYLWPVYAYRAMIDAAPVQHGEAMAPDNPMTTPGIIWRSDDLTTPIEGWRGTLEIRAGSAVDSATGPLAELARLRAENERLRADAARLDSGVIAIDAEPGLFANPLTSQVIFKGDLRKYIDEAIEQDTPEWRAKYCVP